MDKDEIADLINRFIADDVVPYEWDDFISTKMNDTYFESIRERCAGIQYKYPGKTAKEYCNASGVIELRKIFNELKS